MAKADFCFTYYDGDATRDMAHMNRLERGAYTDVVIQQRQRGHLSIDDLKKFLSKDFEAVWGALEWIMKKDEDGKYFIEWLENSIEKSKKQAGHQSEKGKKGGRPINKKPDESQLKAELNPNEEKIKPLGNGDGYENGYEIENENEVWTEMIISGTDQTFEQLLMKENRGRKKDIEVNPDWVKGHLAKCYRDSWHFETQGQFRASLMGYLKTCNEKQTEKANGKRTDKDGNTILAGRITETGAASLLAAAELYELRKNDANGDT